MSEQDPTSRAENDVFAALASQLEYQSQIGGVPLSPDQQMLLGTYLAERRDRLAAEAEHVEPTQVAASSSQDEPRVGQPAPDAREEQQAPRESARAQKASPAPTVRAEPTTDPEQSAQPAVESKRTYSREPQETDAAKKRSKRQVGGGLPSVESFISTTTGRLPWQDPEADEAPHKSSAASSGAEDAKSETGSADPVTPKSDETPQAEPPASTPSASTRESLEAIRASLGDCTRCGLSESRTNIVFGVGNPRARLMLIGEAPGYHEDQKAEPFVGKAGQLLDKMIVAMGLSRDEVYISNVLKCRPPDNRNPHGEEVAHCSPFLKRQIFSVDPDVIITLGKFASTFVLGREVRITKDRGRWQEAYDRPVMPTFHPSYLLRQPDAKREAWQDLQAVMAKMGLDGASS